MIWNVVVRHGPHDSYLPPLPAGAPLLFVSFDQPTDPHRLPNDALRVIRDGIGREPSPEVTDFLSLAMAIYFSDLRVPRTFAADRWSREFLLHVPVLDVNRWDSCSDGLNTVLNFLTGDEWRVEFRSRAPLPPPELEARALHPVDCACLFSGGLDSLVGAIDLLASGSRVALVGHHGSGITNPVQQNVLEELARRYQSNFLPFMFHVQPQRIRKAPGEPTMRSRSILFLALGTAVASTIGDSCSQLVVAENGLISLNVPLTHSRFASSSTRTTHPHFLEGVGQLLRGLGIPLQIASPYKFHTKGEMLSGVRDPSALATCVPLTQSCSHPEAGRYRGRNPGTHCGYCVPCIIRRAALRAAGLQEDSYAIDVLTNPPSADTETGRDFRAFQMALERLRGISDLGLLADILSTGPISPDVASQHAEVYRRGMKEVEALLG